MVTQQQTVTAIMSFMLRMGKLRHEGAKTLPGE